MVARMKPSTSKVSVAPIPEEPSAEYVNNNLPNPDDEPYVSDMHNYQAGEELHRQQSQLAKEWYARARPEMIDANREGTAELFTRFTEDEERKKAEMQKNKEAMTASMQSGDSRKRRNDVMAQCDEQEWKRQPHQQQWMAQSQMQQYPLHVQQQQYVQMQMAAPQQQYHGIQMHHNNQMPSTSTVDSARSVHTPASVHQQSPMEGRNERMAPSRSGMNTSSPTTGLDQQTDEKKLAVPEGDWFENLAVTPANEIVNGVAQQLPPPTQQLPTPQPQPNHHQQQKMQMLQQEELQRMEHQRHQQFLQAQQMNLQQQQMHQQQQQHQMNGGFQFHAQQQAAFMQAQSMYQMRMQQQQQQQQLHHHQQHQQQHHQNGGMGYGMPNDYHK